LIGGLLLASGSAVIAAPITPQFTITADRAAAVPAGHRWAFNDFFPRTATIETGDLYDRRAELEKRRQFEGEHAPQIVAAPVVVPALPSVRGLDFDTFIRLQRGMTEGELLVRAGRPDHESVDNLQDFDRTLYYFPTVANPYTTVVKLRSGRIAHIERVKKF
jgi:hypothetical protein